MPSMTPDLQEALAVQQYMSDLIRQNVAGIPVFRSVRGSGTAAVDMGLTPVVSPAAADRGAQAGVKHQLGVVPNFIFCSVNGPVPFGSFHGAAAMAYAATAIDFTLDVFTPGYTGGVSVNVIWMAVAIQF